MIVDIQGVGNLWTDPQIHSLAGDDYGDGNLGVGGMALFFSTSRYGPVARSLGLPLFALSPAEQAVVRVRVIRVRVRVTRVRVRSDPRRCALTRRRVRVRVRESRCASPRPNPNPNPDLDPNPEQVRLAEVQGIALVADKCSRLSSPDRDRAPISPDLAAISPELAPISSAQTASSASAIQLMKVLYHSRAKSRGLLTTRGL